MVAVVDEAERLYVGRLPGRDILRSSSVEPSQLPSIAGERKEGGVVGIGSIKVWGYKTSQVGCTFEKELRAQHFSLFLKGIITLILFILSLYIFFEPFLYSSPSNLSSSKSG